MTGSYFQAVNRTVVKINPSTRRSNCGVLGRYIYRVDGNCKIIYFFQKFS